MPCELKRDVGSHISPDMRKSSFGTPLAALAFLLGGLSTPAVAEIVGSDALACADLNAAAVRVHIAGFKNGDGTVRVQAYGPNPADFLATGKWVRRVEVQLQGRRSLDVCLRLPRFGDYAIAVRHDANANGKSDWNDGAGFSRNPGLSLFHLKPGFADVVISVSRDMPAIPIMMNYRHGFSIGPESDTASR